MQSKLNPLYRTKLCRHFLKGKCSRSDCAFLHAAVEPEKSFRRHARVEKPVLLPNREQEVLEEDAEDEDDDEEDEEDDSSGHLKTVPCKFFARGICSRGKLCKFLHELNADGAPIGPPPADGGWSLNPYRNRRGPYFTIPDNFIFIAGKLCVTATRFLTVINCTDVDAALNDLAKRNTEECWTSKDSVSSNDLLLAYIVYLLKYIQASENRNAYIYEYEGNAIIDTRLRTDIRHGAHEIYMVLIKNSTDKQKYFFLRWATMSDLYTDNTLRHWLPGDRNKLPKRAEFSATLEEEVFNPKLDIIPDIEHIVREHGERLREHPTYRSLSKEALVSMVQGNIDLSIRLASENRFSVVPFYNFKGRRIQLLMPVYVDSVEASFALLLSKENARDNVQFYNGTTMLTLDMAYTNARLLGRIEAHWLKFIRKDENASMVRMAPNFHRIPRPNALNELV